MGKVLLIDLAICNGCHNCQIACKDEHVANDWSPIAKPQPDTGQFWNKVINLERGSVPKVQVTYHHTYLPALRGGPLHRGLHRRRHLSASGRHRHHRPGQVQGQPAVRRGLPLRERHLLQRRSQHRPEVHLLRPSPRCGLDRDPLLGCLSHRGLHLRRRGRPGQIKAKLAAAELLKPELPTRPRVYYLNLPKKWIAGAVYEPADR